MFVGSKNQIILLLVLILKVCYTFGETETSNTPTYKQALQENNSSVTSYFRQDPYGPNTYAFGYEINDKNTNNVQFRDERRYANGTVQGSYGYVRPDGRITVTHYLSDKERGHLSHTDTFQAGEQHKWEEHWPAVKPAIGVERPGNAMMSQNATFDDKQHLNVTTGEIRPEIANGLKEQYGINVPQAQKVKDVEQQQVQPETNPTLMDIVNGKIPLTGGGKNNKTLGFETVQNYIPEDFPIAPFVLPERLKDKVNAHAEDAKRNKTKINKYSKGKINNAEKSMDMEILKKSQDSDVRNKTKDISENVQIKAASNVTEPSRENSDQKQTIPFVEKENNLPQSLADAGNEERIGADWYQQVINDARKDFLENIPNLKQMQ